MEPLEILLELIFQRYFPHTYCFTIISDGSYDLLTTNITSVRLSKVDMNTMISATDLGCPDYVVQTSNPDTFMAVFKQVRRESNTRKGDRKLIFLPTDLDSDLLNILAEKELTFIPNVLLIIPKPNNCTSYELVTHRFTGPDRGKVTEPTTLDIWDGSRKKFERNANLFPHDIRNLHGKVLKVACFTYKPFTMLDLDEEVTPGGKDGIEYRLVQEFCRWVNCTIELVMEEKVQWGFVHPNGSGTGALGDVVEDRADLGITSLGPWYNTYPFMDFSASILKCDVGCIVPKPRMISRWELPLLGFSVSVWITYSVVLICVTAALILAQGTRKKAWLTTVGISLAQPQPNQAARTRSMLASLYLTSLVMNAAYCAGLACIFTVPNHERSIDTVEDLIDSGIVWAAPHDAWIYSLMPSSEPKIKQIVRQFRNKSPDELKKQSFERKIAFAIEKLPAGYPAIGSYITQSAASGYQLMLEDFYFEYSIVAARKGSAYLGRVSEMVGRMHETGIFLAWETQIAMKYMDYKVQLAIKYSRVKSPPEVASLTFHHVMGIFIIHGTGIFASIIIFIWETARGRKRQTNKI